MSSRTIKNVSSGLLAQTWMALLGLVALPVFARGLGAERYGLLALNLALINIAGLADLGVGRAASKYLAEDYERNEVSRTQRFISTSMTVTVVMGLLGIAVLTLTTPWLVHFALRIPEQMQAEAKTAFWITGIGLLGILLRLLFEGLLAGHHCMVVVNFANVAINSFRVTLSMIAIWTGYSLLSVLIINVILVYLHAAGLWWYARRHFAPRIQFGLGWHAKTARQLLRLGLISTLSILLASVVFLYADRFIIAAFFPLALTGYYTMAFDISSRQTYVSNSVVATFFPVFSGHGATSATNLESSYLQATKAVAVGTTGLAMLLAVFGRALLTYWVDPSYGTNSTSSLVVLAIAWLIATYVQVPYTLVIAAASKPGICVRVFSSAIVVHIVVSLLLLRMWGIVGVAIAFVLAYLLVFCWLLSWVSRNLVRISVPAVLQRCFLGPWVSAVASGVVLRFLLPFIHNLTSVLTAMAVGYLIYFLLCVKIAYNSEERQYLLGLVRNRFRPGGRRSLTPLGGEP